MQPNLRRVDRVVRILLGGFCFFAAAVLFTYPLSRILALLFGVFVFWEAASAKCPLQAKLDSQKTTNASSCETTYLLGLLAVQTIIAYEWWSAGWEKVSSPAFVDGIQKTLGFFAGKNPFPWYKSFLEGFAMQYGSVFAYAVEWSQVAISLSLILAAGIFVYTKKERVRGAAVAVIILALAGGLLMNANFYLAAAWTGPGTKGSNVVMFWIQAALLYTWLSTYSLSHKTKMSQ